MEDYKIQLSKLQSSEQENLICVDCSQSHPSWCSLDFGTYICLTCSGVHRNFGVHISFVRSTNLDNWSESQFKRMSLGGNKKFKDFVGNGFFDNNIQDRYYSLISAEYKERLTCLLNDCQFNSSNVVCPKRPIRKNSGTLNTNTNESMGGILGSMASQVLYGVSSTFENIQQSPYTQQSVKKLYEWFNSEDELDKKPNKT
eukprot:NODE_125_length_17255_cov_0.877827.p9 type:complete len:200 gc:universal NODE_125_length_17255_cov_0.877827:2894-2295(-)